MKGGDIMTTRQQLRELVKDTETDLRTMKKRITEYDSEAVENIATDIANRMSGIIADMQVEGIAVAIQAGHNGGNSPIYEI